MHDRQQGRKTLPTGNPIQRQQSQTQKRQRGNHAPRGSNKRHVKRLVQHENAQGRPREQGNTNRPIYVFVCLFN